MGLASVSEGYSEEFRGIAQMAERERLMAHVPVRHSYGAACSRRNRRSCRFVLGLSLPSPLRGSLRS
jgi:hypothetical protein